MFKKYLSMLIVSMALITVGCENSQEGSLNGACYTNNACDAGLVCIEGTCSTTTEIRPNTIVITTQEANNELKSGADESRLVFPKSIRTEKFKTGDIIAFQANDVLKQGLIARITKIENVDNDLAFQVERVNPLFAIGKVKLDIKRLVAQRNGEDSFIPTKEEMESFKTYRKDDISFSKGKTIPFEKKWELQDGEITASGNLSLTYLLEAVLDLEYPGSWDEIKDGNWKKNTGINEFQLNNTFKLNADAKLEVNIEKDAGFKTLSKEYKKDIAKDVSLAKFPIPLPISGITLNGNVKLSLELIPKAKVEGQATIEAKSRNTIKANIRYANKEFEKPAFDFDSNNTLTQDIRIAGSASVTLRAVPTFELSAGVGVWGVGFDDLIGLALGTEIDFTPLKVEAELNQHFETDFKGYGVNARACFRADAELTIKPYVEINFKEDVIDPISWKPEGTSLVKGWSWLDFLVDGGYFGSSADGCHAGLKNKNGRCVAEKFWSVVGKEEGKKCVQLLCSQDEECQVNADTADHVCIANLCVKPEAQNNKDASYEFVTIPEGTFVRGCVEGDEMCKNAETPAATVKMREYKIGKTEVTIKQYKKCVDAGHCKAINYEEYHNANFNDHPITHISWAKAYNYCHWLGEYRLPTEAEWEKAARGNMSSIYVWGDEEPTCNLTVMEGEEGDGCGKDTTAPVGSKASDRSSYGVMDMAGNASEWTSDYFDPAYYSKPESLYNPRGPRRFTTSSSYVTVRGGNWTSSTAKRFRTSRRDYRLFSSSSNTVGFRCAK